VAEQVLGALHQKGAEQPLDTLACVDHLIENDAQGWHFWSWRDEARPLFETALRSPDPRVVALATELINKLGSRGFLDFRDLLR